MKWSQFFTSSIGKKLVMSLTGLFLITFLVVHAGLNACIWAGDHGEMFNKSAHFMGSTVVVRLVEVGLFVFFIVHIIQGYVLGVKNINRRGHDYKISLGNRGSKWYSRTMGTLGTLLLLFLNHAHQPFLDFIPFCGLANIRPLARVVYDSKPYHNLYQEMLNVFDNPLVVVLYVLGCISLAYHLMHGFQSAFRTLGVNNNRYLILLRYLGNGFSVLVSVAFAMMPISMYFGWVKA